LKSYAIILKKKFVFLIITQRPGDGRILASVHQPRGQRGPIQESSGLGRRLTHAGGLFFSYCCSQSTAATYRVYFPYFFFLKIYLPFKQIKEKKKLIYVYFLFYA